MIRVLFLMLCFGSLGCAAPRGPIVVEPLCFDVDDGPVRGWLARVDLSDPSVQWVVTGPLPGHADAPRSAEALLQATPCWAEQHGVSLAVNANFFGVVDDGTATGDETPWADIIGLCVSDGEVVSPRRAYADRHGPVLIFDRAGRASITTEPTLVGVHDAVAGVGPSPTVPHFGGLLVTDGRNTGATCRVDPLARHPRTAAGIDRSGETLWLVVVDGRQPGWSVGVTLPELANVLIQRGVDRALNLDGGGSSSFYFDQDPARTGLSSDTITNRPSSGRHRPVAAHLGVRLTPDR